MFAVSAPTPGQTTKRASLETSGSRMLGRSRWNTRIAMTASIAVCLEMGVQVGIGRTGPAEQLEPLDAGLEPIGGAGLDMDHRALDQIVARAGIRIEHDSGARLDVIDRLLGMPLLDRVVAGMQRDMVHRALRGAGAGPDQRDRAPVASTSLSAGQLSSSVRTRVVSEPAAIASCHPSMPARRRISATVKALAF